MKTYKFTLFLFLCQFVVAQQHPGDIDTSFTSGFFGPFPQYIIDIAQQTDEKILVAGNFSSLDDLPAYSIVRLNLDGSRDISFNAPSGSDYITKIILQPDGKMLVLATYGSISGIFRLNSNGSFDTSFNTGTNTNPSPEPLLYGPLIKTAIVQSDGKIVIAGEFDSFNGVARNKLARLNADGSLDSGFNTLKGLPLPAESYNSLTVFKQPNQKIIIAGVHPGATVLERGIDIARLNSDGSVDDSFILQAQLYSQTNITSVQTQTDGKILVVGFFLTGNNVSAIIRLNADGSVDTTFNPGTGATGAFRGTIITHALIEPSGKIILMGNFQFYSDTYRLGIIRIYNDGSVDTSFLPMLYCGDGPVGILQADGKIVNGGGSGCIRRLLSDVNLGLSSETLPENILIYPNPIKNSLLIKSSIAISQIEIYNSIGQVMIYQKENFSEKTIDLESFPAGIYFVKIASDKKHVVRKIIKN